MPVTLRRLERLCVPRTAVGWLVGMSEGAQVERRPVYKWAAGISDTLALGLLNEATGLGLPIVAVPCRR